MWRTLRIVLSILSALSVPRTDLAVFGGGLGRCTWLVRREEGGKRCINSRCELVHLDPPSPPRTCSTAQHHLVKGCRRGMFRRTQRSSYSAWPTVAAEPSTRTPLTAAVPPSEQPWLGLSSPWSISAHRHVESRTQSMPQKDAWCRLRRHTHHPPPLTPALISKWSSRYHAC